MHAVGAMLQALPPVLVALLVAGHLARRSGRFPSNTAEVLNRLIIDLCLPASVLSQLPGVRPSWELSSLIVVPWLLCGLAFAVSRVLARLFSLNVESERALALGTGLGNTTFLGYPLCGALLGEESLRFAAVYAQFGTAILLAVVVPLALPHEATLSARRGWSRVMRFPPFIALVLAMMPFSRPAVVEAMLHPLSNMLAPLALFLIGFELRVVCPKRLGLFLGGLLLKLGLMPLAAWCLVRWFAPTPAVGSVVVIESAMPAMLSLTSMAVSARVEPDLVTALVGWGALASLATVPLWALALS